MCGINGIFAYNAASGAPNRHELLATRDAMAARGPDGLGEWWSTDRRLGLGHRRLALLDLSEAGAQPMVSADKRYVVTFNGEIYNYPELRSELERDGVRFRSRCDTEVLLLLYAREGEAMLSRLRGMFAFAIWDEVTRSLFLARDPYGIKPLYISNDGWTFRFASQVKALLAGGRISRAPEPAGTVGFYLWGHVPEPFTLYRDIEALPAGCSLVVNAAGPGRPIAYASVSEAFANGAANSAAAAEVWERVREGVRESVEAHLLADVELGVFLSGGVDSGALLGVMAELADMPPRAITLRFEEFRGSAHDEVGRAAEAAKRNGVEHVVRTVTQTEFASDLPHILAAMDQPSIDGINTWFVAKACREMGLKAAMSGVGGDELLAGYNSFEVIPQWVKWLRPFALVPGFGRGMRSIAHLAGLQHRSPKATSIFEYGSSYAGAYFLKRALFLPHELGEFLDPQTVKKGLERLEAMRYVKSIAAMPAGSPTSRVGALESSLYLRNQLLRDADWAGMAHSVEIRTPLVDWSLLQTIAPIVPHLRRPGAGKEALAAVPRFPLPQDVVLMPKTGFTVPTGRWVARPTEATHKIMGRASRVWSGEVFGHFATSFR